ncbi:hypothetical protein [Moritella sp. 28]|uniref:hypothetical protein n=1 Tax=Moritella sp. 28 TaxID=2746232 RepID=UPI001BAD5DD5|nr:hypothetical protein [Moritella sp. 28]QUM84528.1 hypothetical protein HWV02_08435 [Moritella sp. 28]
MHGKYKLSKIATILASCSLVISCGGEQTSKTTSDIYDYSKLPICLDADRNNACGQQEEQVPSLKSVSSANTAPYLIDNSGYFFTATANAAVISPFTTLIQNEVLFNPQVAGSEEQAKALLKEIFGTKYNIDFYKLNDMHGPKEPTKLLLASFKHALSLQGDSKALKISAAVDKMVSSRNFDITESLSQADLDNSYVNLSNRYLIPGSYPVNTLFSSSPITMNENTGMLLALAHGDKLLQVDTTTGSSQLFTPTSTTPSLPSMSTFDDHDDDDDDDDDCDDDDYGYKDHCDGQTQLTSTMTFAAQGKHDKNAYLIYQPTIYGDRTVSKTCNSTGNNGIYLTELGKNSKASPLSSALSIDTFSKASGGGEVIPVEPSLPDSSADCKNNNISNLAVSYNQDWVTAVFTNGYGGDAELQQLSSSTLKQTGKRYTLSSSQADLILSKEQKLLLVLQTSGTAAAVVDAETLGLRGEIMKDNIDFAAFVNDDKSLIVSDKTNTLSWFNIAQPTSPNATLVLSENVTKLASDPTGKFSAALTNKKIYLIDNKSQTVIYSQDYSQRYVYGMSMLSNRIIISRSGAIDYIQFDNLTGSPIKVAEQMLSKDLLTRWSAISGRSLVAMTLAELLQDSGEEDAISQPFSGIDLQWLPTSATTIEEVKEVVISGVYRDERISLSKVI